MRRVDRCTKEVLERKAQRLAALLSLPFCGDLNSKQEPGWALEAAGRSYRVIWAGSHPHQGSGVFCSGYMSAGELWDRLDFAETALRLKELADQEQEKRLASGR